MSALAAIYEFTAEELHPLLEIHRQPAVPAYREQIIIPADGTASPLAFPDVTIALAEILPPR